MTFKRIKSTVAVVALAAATAALVVYSTARLDTTGDVVFRNALPIPPIDRGTVEDGVRTFQLTAQTGTSEIFLGKSTETWGINGPFLGPTLRVSNGEAIRIDVANRLPEDTTLHWHGMHLPAIADGGPHQVIRSGTTWTAEWTVDQPAATVWYHPHLHGTTAEQTYRGIAGMFIIDDPASPDDLPHTYGIDDIPMIIQDRSFGPDGALEFGAHPFSFTGLIGDTVTVNGVVGPYVDVTTERVRLRLLNASGARVYNLGLADGQRFSVIAGDSALLPSPVEVDRIQLSPGERAEVVLTMQPGETALLRSFPPDLGVDPFTSRFNGGDDTLDILELRGAPHLDPSPELPTRLRPDDAPDPPAAHEIRRFELGSASINGSTMDHRRIDLTVERGATEIWEVENASGIPHNFHVHDIRFRVLDVNGNPPAPAFAGWKDTVYVGPGDTVRIIGAFEDYADPRNPYMFHCHILDHEDLGMMGQFVVTAPDG